MMAVLVCHDCCVVDAILNPSQCAQIIVNSNCVYCVAFTRSHAANQSLRVTATQSRKNERYGIENALPRSMIPVTESGRIPSETAFFPALSCRFQRTSGRKKHRKMEAVFRPELHRTRKRENPGKFPFPDSIRKQEGSERETSRKSTFPFGTWPEKFVSQPDVT